MRTMVNEREYKKTNRPAVGEIFVVEPAKIDQTLFFKSKKAEDQEIMRKRILEAFKKMEENPKYAQPFKTFIPEKTWNKKTGIELAEIATDLGGKMADNIEQALEWAQRIANGESWKSLCVNPDSLANQRVINNNGFVSIVGGSEKSEDCPPSLVEGCYDFGSLFYCGVPLVVFR